MTQLHDVPDGSTDARPDGEPTPVEADVLELGRAPRVWTARQRRNAGWAMILAAVLLGAGSWWWSWWQSSDPTLSQTDVVSVYRSPSATSDPVGWDRASTFSQPGDPDASPVTEPPACVVLLVPNRAPISLDRVGAVLTPGLGTGVWAGSATTYRYTDPAEARRKFDQLQAAAAGCSSFRYGDTRFEITSVVADRSGRARSELAFVLTDSDPDVPGPSRTAVVRYGNTISWVATSQRTREPTEIADSLVRGFRDLG